MFPSTFFQPLTTHSAFTLAAQGFLNDIRLSCDLSIMEVHAKALNAWQFEILKS